MNNIERHEVVKAGGWSLANAERARSVMNYVKSNQEIRYFIPSAPGAVNGGDIKVTDNLIMCYRHRERGEPFEDDLERVYSQFITIANELGYPGMEKILDPIEQGVKEGKDYDWLISRGEAVNGRMWADILDWHFVDPTELIRFRVDGRFDERSYRIMGSRLRGGDRFVIPGFYGLGADGKIKTFQRDGSDVTGGLIAHGVNASIYRNLTSTIGVLSANPDIVHEEAILIDRMTYQEYRELGNGGFKVLHRDTIIPVASAGIPVNVRHSEKPDSSGTLICLNRPDVLGQDVIGIAGKRGFVGIKVSKLGMDEDKGIAEKILRIIGRNGISFAHLPTENDSVSIVFSEEQLNAERQHRIMAEIERQIVPTELDIRSNIGILSVVGQGIKKNGSVIVGKLVNALNDRSIKHGIIHIEPSITIKAFLDSDRIDDAVCASHKALIENK